MNPRHPIRQAQGRPASRRDRHEIYRKEHFALSFAKVGDIYRRKSGETISNERVRQICAQGLAKLRARYGSLEAFMEQFEVEYGPDLDRQIEEAERGMR